MRLNASLPASDVKDKIHFLGKKKQLIFYLSTKLLPLLLMSFNYIYASFTLAYFNYLSLTNFTFAELLIQRTSSFKMNLHYP